MASVSNLAINLQTGSDNTYYASWEFASSKTTTTTTSSSVKVGSLVSINEGATYYNGVKIPDWVKSQNWYISSIKNDRAVLGKNESKTNNIKSPINTKDITVVGSSSSSSSSSSSTVSVSNLDYYEVKWYYDSGDGVWFSGGESNVTETNATYSPPANTVKIKVSVKPVSKTKKVNNKETPYWTGTAVTVEYSVDVDPPEVPPTPTVTIKNFVLTATIDNISDARSDKIQFQIYDDTTLFNTGTVEVSACKATYVCNVTAGGKYRVRCRSVNIYSTTDVYSKWSEFTSEETTIPTAVTGLSCKAKTETSIYLKWTAVNNATSYTIAYTTEKDYFDGSDSVTEISNVESAHYEITGIETGDEYFFRVRAVNSEGESEWSDIVSLAIGEVPSAPTTWSSTTTAIVGEALTLYWVHNSEDGSTQHSAEIEIYVDGIKNTIEIETADEEDDEKTMYYSIDTSTYSEGVQVKWRVRTAGVTGEMGDWSIQRTIDIYAPATLALSVTDNEGNAIDTLTSFPLYITGIPGPITQNAIGYHLSVLSNDSYTTIDNVGNTQNISSGEEVYSKHFDISDRLVVAMSAGHINLQNGISYTVSCTVSMDSGLVKTETYQFSVSWTDETYDIDAKVAIDKDTLTAYINPYCVDFEGNMVEGVTLSVYRREFDGSFTELATGIDNMSNTFIPDPHPALDYARYRVVAISDLTGAISFYDVPGYPVGEKSAVIQWNEEWVNFDTDNEDALERPSWSGSLLKLPYNLNVSDNRSPDVSLIKYIGRKYPVSYYGTQIGETSSWSMVIPKNDTDTLYTLRRLSVWMGDVYVREPSGSGYWANISVSFSQKHLELTIPVTLDITRVSGGA